MQFDLVTFIFELINFVVLAWLLQRVVYKPLAAAIRERREEIQQTRAKAEEQLAAVDARAAALAVRDRELDLLRETIFAEATAAASAERAKLLGEAREDAAAERQRAQATLAAEREAALGWVREVTVDRGVEVAGRMLLELVPDAAHEALFERLLATLASRSELAEGAADGDEGDVHADAAFARMATPEEAKRLRTVLETALGAPVRLAVTEDEGLGAGVTVRVRDRVYDASVAGQLELLRDDARLQLAKEAL